MSLRSVHIAPATFLYDERAEKSNAQLRDFLAWNGPAYIARSLHAPTYVVLGGDGTILQAIKEYADQHIPFLGINFGSKGFLLNNQSILSGSSLSFVSRNYPLLLAEICISNACFLATAFNEIQIKASGWQLVDLSLKIAKKSQIRMRGDGILIVTPAGSTGYNYSAGWPVLPHSSNLFIATPLLSFDPIHLRPIPFPNEQTVVITNNTERDYPLSIYADGKEMQTHIIDPIRITISKSPHHVTILVADSQIDHWDEKVYLEQGFSLST